MKEFTKTINVLIALVENQWISYFSYTEERDIANQLIDYGLVVLETQEPQRSGDAPIGAWKLLPHVRKKILNLGTKQLLIDIL